MKWYESDEFEVQKSIKSFVIPSQQSALLAQLLAADEKSLWQLLFPQVKRPAQCESKSQSPLPLLHWLEFEQQLQSVVGIPLHCPVGVAVVVNGAFVVLVLSNGWKIANICASFLSMSFIIPG